MKKQTYIKPQIETVAIETIDMLAESETQYSVKKDGLGINLFGTFETGGNASDATSKESSDVWNLDDEE